MKNYGFNPKDIVIKQESWKFGSNIPLHTLNEDADWTDYLPTYEAQADKYETWGCTVWGTQNQIETLLKFLYNETHNFDERYNYNVSEITIGGGDPDRVAEDIRKIGLIEGIIGIPDTYEDMMTPRPMTDVYITHGKKWVDVYTFNHEWVIPSNPDKMKELVASSLKYSPIALSVTAWINGENNLYIDEGMQNNHWCLCYGFRVLDGKIILKIFDSYDSSHKELHPDHKVSFAKRINITKREVVVKKNLLTRFIEKIKCIIYLKK